MISNKQLFHEEREQEIENESIEDLQNRMDNSLDHIQDNLNYFLGGILEITKTYNPKQNGN